MPLNYCPRCGKPVESEHEALRVCPDCQAARLKALAEREALYPSAEQLGLAGPDSQLSPLIAFQLHACGRRIVRKPEPMGG
jgi:hypothetical protein